MWVEIRKLGALSNDDRGLIAYIICEKKWEAALALVISSERTLYSTADTGIEEI
jgi:hypothetical protein